jgi:hypothetical protein
LRIQRYLIDPLRRARRRRKQQQIVTWDPLTEEEKARKGVRRNEVF